MIDLSGFGGSIQNPYGDTGGSRGFSILVEDENVGGKVLHISKFQTLIQALGYFKYTLCTSPKNNFRIFFRGQENAYGKIYQPTLYRKCTQEGALTGRDGELNRQIALCKEDCRWFNKLDDSVVEGVLQQYGMRTRWIDAVDNIWIALWFACHHAWCWKDGDMEYLHYSIRSPRLEGEGVHYAYIYVLGFNSGYSSLDKKKRRTFVPGMSWGENAEMLDLRYAIPSLFLRPHAQHGVLLRSFKYLPNGGMRYNSDMSDLVQGVIRFDLLDGLEWLGYGASLDVSSVFPPPAFDSGYGDLLMTEREMRKSRLGKKVHVSGYRKSFTVDLKDVLHLQRI